MAVDSSWDNSGLPPQRKGMATWLKVLLGCGVIFLILLGGCVGTCAYGIHKFSELGKAQWPRYVETVKALESPDSTKALYEANPNLAKRFSDEDAFEKQVADWRPSIQTPPAEMPSLTTGRAMAFEGRKSRYSHIQVGSQSEQQIPDGRKTSVAGYKMANNEMLVVVWVDDQLTDIEFEQNRH